jgi:DNA-binding transcriptional LysR family regulator
MTLVQLRHLISLARTGSFSKSAQALHLTQPALSRSIRALEDELGMPLFDRVGRSNELTAFGREVLERSRHLVSEADELRDSGRRLREGEGGTVRVGMGSGPGAMLMTPFLMHMAKHHPRMRVAVARGGTDLLVQSLRERSLDALVVDARSLEPAPDLELGLVREMRGTFLCRRGHPLARLRSVAFEAVQRYPIASTPLSDEVARTLVEAYGPQAHPAHCVTLQCEEVPSLVEVVRQSDAVLLAIRAAAPGLVELKMDPPMDGVARFGLVTLRRRTEAPALAILRALMQALMRD